MLFLRGGSVDVDRIAGNVLMDRLFGAEVHVLQVPGFSDLETAAEMQPWYEDFAECYGIRLGAVLAAPRVPVTATGGVLAR